MDHHDPYDGFRAPQYVDFSSKDAEDDCNRSMFFEQDKPSITITPATPDIGDSDEMLTYLMKDCSVSVKKKKAKGSYHNSNHSSGRPGEAMTLTGSTEVQRNSVPQKAAWKNQASGISPSQQNSKRSRSPLPAGIPDYSQPPPKYSLSVPSKPKKTGTLASGHLHRSSMKPNALRMAGIMDTNREGGVRVGRRPVKNVEPFQMIQQSTFQGSPRVEIRNIDAGLRTVQRKTYSSHPGKSVRIDTVVLKDKYTKNQQNSEKRNTHSFGIAFNGHEHIFNFTSTIPLRHATIPKPFSFDPMVQETVRRKLANQNEAKAPMSTMPPLFHAHPAGVLKKAPFIPIKSTKPLVCPVSPDLHLKRRVEERRTYDKKCQELQEVNDKIRKERAEVEKSKLAQELVKLRKEREFKATPAPVFRLPQDACDGNAT